MTKNDILILQSLAKQQMEYAAAPQNKEREKAWYLHNDLKLDRPMVTIEEGTFFHEVSRPLKCETEKGRAFERQLMANIIGREDLDDDRVTPESFAIMRPSWFLPFGMDAKKRRAHAEDLGFEIVPVIHDLEEDFDKLGSSAWGYSKENPDLALAQDIFAGIIPVEEVSTYPYIGLAHTLVNYMSMETFYTSMYDCPELLHQLINRLSEEVIIYHKELESEAILITNNRLNPVPQGTISATNELTYKDGAALKDMWGYSDSQESVGLSPEMFNEFIFSYQKKLTDMWGLMNYGCCEAVHTVWDDYLSKCKNLRKLSISPWCDEEMMGERLQGTRVIYHRKPSPNLVGEKNFNEEEFSKHIIKTLKAAKGCKLEFSLRDIYSAGGEKARGKKVVRLIWDLIDKYWH